jgi:hypothetical protein
MKFRQSVHPEIGNFYELPENMKKGGKKRRPVKKVATNINQQKVVINLSRVRDPVSYEKHRAITRVNRLQTPNLNFANPPKTQLPSYYAIPNGIGLIDPVNPNNFQGDGNMRAKKVEINAPLGSDPNPSQIPNRRGIQVASSNSSRAIPSAQPNQHGGVLRFDPRYVNEREQESAPLESQVQYFKPSGRDNRVAPEHAAQHSASASGFFPLGGQQPQTREQVMAREQLPPVAVENFQVPMRGFTDRNDPMYQRQQHVLSQEKRASTMEARAREVPGSASEHEVGAAAAERMKHGGLHRRSVF